MQITLIHFTYICYEFIHTPTHPHTLAPMVLPCFEARVESLLWYSVQGSCCTASDVKCCKTLNSKPYFSLEKSQKSQGVRSGKYGGYGINAIYLSTKNCCTAIAMSLAVLLQCTVHPLYFSGHFIHTSSHKREGISM